MWCYLTYWWYWRHENIQKIVLHYPSELLSSVNKNSTIVYIYLILQFKDENKASYFYVQGGAKTSYSHGYSVDNSSPKIILSACWGVPVQSLTIPRQTCNALWRFSIKLYNEH